MDDVTGRHGIQVLIPPDSGKREGERPGWTGGRFSFMRRVLATDLGRETYRRRQVSIEPVYGHTKPNRKIYRLDYRDRKAVRTEWRLVTMTHNLTKLHKRQLAAVAAWTGPAAVTAPRLSGRVTSDAQTLADRAPPERPLGDIHRALRVPERIAGE